MSTCMCTFFIASYCVYAGARDFYSTLETKIYINAGELIKKENMTPWIFPKFRNFGF